MKLKKISKQNNYQKKSKGQVGMEFLIILGGVVFFVSILLLAIQNNQEEKSKEKQMIQLKEIALTVQNEISLASSSSDGYERIFELPERSGGEEYDIILEKGAVYIKTTDGRFALALPVPEVTGQINKTYNKIEKISGEVRLNQ